MNALNEILSTRAIVTLAKPVNGFWDGGAKSRFEFTPAIERTPGDPAIRWGCYAANLWFVLPVGKSAKAHFAALRRKLKGSPPRNIEIVRG